MTNKCSIISEFLLKTFLVIVMMINYAHATTTEYITERAYFEDPSNLLTIEQIKQKTFTPYQELLTGGYKTGTFWLKLNMPASHQELVLKVRPPFINEIEVFDPASPEKKQVTGSDYPLNSSSIDAFSFNVLLPAYGQDRELYIRIKSKQSYLVYAEIMPLAQYQRIDHTEQFIYMAYATFTLVITLLLFLTWIIAKERLVGIFIIQQLTIFLHTIFKVGLVRIVLDGYSDNHEISYIGSLLTLLTCLVSALANKFLLEDYGLKPNYKKIFNFYIFSSLAIIALYLIGSAIALKINIIFALTFVLFLWVTSIFGINNDLNSIKLNAHPLKILQIFCSINLIVWAFAILALLGFIESASIAINSIFVLGMLSGLFFFTFLQYRVKYEKAITLSLLYEKEKLSATLEQSQSSVMITNLDATIEYVNQAFVNNTGYSREEIIGQKPSLLKSNKTPRATYEAMWAALLDGKAWQGEVINLNKQGEELIELTWISPIRKADGTIGHYLGVKENITERKQKDALLLAAKERAENLTKTKTQFLANMSHEIRTPMAAIIGFSDLALLIDMPTKVNEYLKNINSASNHLLTILNDILDMSKLEAGQMALKLTSFKLADLQETVYGLLMNTAQTKGLTLNIDIAPSVPKVLIGDSLRLKQVLINLLGNAIKFTGQGSVTLSISLLKLTTTEARLLFAVTDTGIGISAEQQDKLFEPFSQADDGFDRHFEGTGLGLAISQDLVRLMSGSIKLDSRPGLGSCFSFEVVLPLADLATSEPQVIATSGLNPEPLLGIRVLVVEDNAFNQMFISKMLENFGTSTVLVNNGLEALVALEKNHFDIVLMDLHMPTMDGYEATLEIRKRPCHDSLPVIAFTASVTEEEKRQCLDTGMNDFVGKPTHKEDLLATLQRWL